MAAVDTAAELKTTHWQWIALSESIKRGDPQAHLWNEVLQYFDVQRNNLTGTIPDNIGKCTSFEILGWLSRNVSTSTLLVERFSSTLGFDFLQVATMSIRGNKLTGRIPEITGLMQALAVLDLSDNHLTGTIPPILGNLSYTGKLDLSKNDISGPIPGSVGDLEHLLKLDLSANGLSDNIPQELGKL